MQIQMLRLRLNDHVGVYSTPTEFFMVSPKKNSLMKNKI
jgi:hypothetical protein